MELPIVYYAKDEFHETNTGNKICRSFTTRESPLCGTQNIVLNGKCILMKDVVFRGDIGPIRAGKYVIVKSNTVVRPSYKKLPKGLTFMPVHIGDSVMIEEDCVISSSQVGAYVHIGKGSVLGKCSVLKECCRVLPGSVVAPNAVFPPFSTIAGNPAKVIGREPYCTAQLMAQATKEFYEKFLPSTAISRAAMQ